MTLILSTSARWMIESSGRDDVAALLARIGLDGNAEQPRLVNADAFYQVIETIVADGDDDLPFRCAQSLDIDSYGALGLAFKTSANLKTALGRVERYGALVSEAINYELREDGAGRSAFVISGRPSSRPGMQVTNEAALAGVLSFCRQAVEPGLSIAPLSVSFTHGKPPSAQRHQAYFGCPVDFGAELNALHVSDEFLDTSTRLADDALSSFLSARLDDELRVRLVERGIESTVRRTVAEGLADGVPPMHVVAGRLAMSERTLRRRLADEDLRYDEIVTDVQKTVATALLVTTDHSLVDVAFLTGYSDQSAFQRAFKRWTGSTPTEVRRRGAEGVGRHGQSSVR